MLLIRYHSTDAYKLYCLDTNKVEVSKDVIMKESEAWDWSKSQSNSGAVLTPELTFEDASESEGSEDKSESKDDSEGDFEGEFDSDPDSDDEPNSGSQDSGGGQTSEGEASEAGLTSREGQAFDIVPASEEDFEQVQRIRKIPRRFVEFGML